jgi:2,4-dienoyl-CoA reductase-like NADH-dependent reductase (Old Yellow Enzyme family)
MSYLLKPLQIGSLTLSNRLIMPPIATGKAEPDGKASQELLDYYAQKFTGGYISLIIIEHSYICPEGKANNGQLSTADDSVVENLKKLAEAIHQNGSKAVMQINHAGSATKTEIIGTIPVGPSEVAKPPRGRSIPRKLTKEEIADIITSFQNAARRVKEAGFDGVEIHAAHGYLLNQFYSPLSNQRNDEYGGDVLNRIRIHLQVIEAVRKEVGQDFPLLLRLGACDFMEGGTTVEDSLIAAQEFERAGLDILDVSGGFYGFTIPGVTGQGYFAPLTEAIKKVVSIPVILTGGITEIQTAEQLLANGKADLIGVGRAVVNDPDWPRKAIESLR